MPGPFPGMDPFLEEPAHWRVFHKQLVAALYQVLLPGLVDQYRARVVVREYASQTPLFTSVLREEHSEEFIEILARPDGRLVTLVEVVTLGNKLTVAGRARYLAGRAEALRRRANVVEIDLLTQGLPTLEFAREGLPEHDQTVAVTRGTAPERFEIYTATVPKRLPKFRLPLAADDKDTVLDLQTVVTRAYDQGGFEKRLAYKGPLPADVKLTPETRAWVQVRLEQMNLR